MTEFPHISTVVLRFLEWTLPQVAERQQRGNCVTGRGRLGAPVGWAEVAGGLPPRASAPAAVEVADEDAADEDAADEDAADEDAADAAADPADPADAVRADVAQVGAHRLMAAAQDRVRRRLEALAGAPLGRAPAGPAAAPTGMAGWPVGPTLSPTGMAGWPAGSAQSRPGMTDSPDPGTAWPLSSAGAPGADTAPPISPPIPDHAMPPRVRLPGAPSPSHAVRRAEPNSDARVAQLQAFSTPEARFRGQTPALVSPPGMAWALGTAGAPGADSAPRFSQPALDQATPPPMRLQGAPGPPHRGPRAEPNSDARVAQLQAFSSPEARLSGAVPDPVSVPPTTWAPGSAGAPGADSSPTFSQPTPNQALPPAERLQGAPAPPHPGLHAEPNSAARFRRAVPAPAPRTRFAAEMHRTAGAGMSPNVPLLQALDPDTGAPPHLTAPHTTSAPHIPPVALSADTPKLPAQSRLLAEAQLRQMLADIIRADALRHGLNLKER